MYRQLLGILIVLVIASSTTVGAHATKEKGELRNPSDKYEITDPERIAQLEKLYQELQGDVNANAYDSYWWIGASCGYNARADVTASGSVRSAFHNERDEEISVRYYEFYGTIRTFLYANSGARSYGWYRLVAFNGSGVIHKASCYS